jgi:hypothetical protein
LRSRLPSSRQYPTLRGMHMLYMACRPRTAPRTSVQLELAATMEADFKRDARAAQSNS